MPFSRINSRRAAVVLGEAANFVAYGYAPAIVVTPLGAMSVILRLAMCPLFCRTAHCRAGSAILAAIMLDERLELLGKIGCFLCLVGSPIIIVNAPSEVEVSSVSDITERMENNPGVAAPQPAAPSVRLAAC